MGQRNMTVIHGQRQEYLAVTADKTLKNTDTGRTMVISASGGRQRLGANGDGSVGAVTCSLPSISDVTAGFKCTLVFVSNHSHSVAGGAGLIYGNPHKLAPMGSAGAEQLSGSTSITLRATEAIGSSEGCTIDIFSDGNKWYITGVLPYNPLIL